MHAVVADEALGRARRGRRPAGGQPAGGRDAEAESAETHGDEIEHAHDHQRGRDAGNAIAGEFGHQPNSQRRADHRAAAIAHDRKAGGHAAPVGEPFDQRRDRRDIADALADAAEEGDEIDEPELVRRDREAEQDQTAAPEDCRIEPGFARPGMFEPAAPDRGGNAEHRNEDFKDVGFGGNRPIATRRRQLGEKELPLARGGIGARQQLRHRQPEHREAVSHPDAEMDRERRGGHQPAIEARPGDGSGAIENSTGRICSGGGNQRAHRRSSFLRWRLALRPPSFRHRFRCILIGD